MVAHIYRTKFKASFVRRYGDLKVALQQAKLSPMQLQTFNKVTLEEVHALNAKEKQMEEATKHFLEE